MRFIILVILFLPHIGLFGQNLPDMNFVYSETDTIPGQIETAKRIKYFIDNKDYDQAIELFSLSRQNKINEIRKDPVEFEYWVNAWTISEEILERYILKIKKQEGHFVFENGIWRIDEN
jgi:hypothetical protein